MERFPPASSEMPYTMSHHQLSYSNSSSLANHCYRSTDPSSSSPSSSRFSSSTKRCQFLLSNILCALFAITFLISVTFIVHNFSFFFTIRHPFDNDLMLSSDDDRPISIPFGPQISLSHPINVGRKVALKPIPPVEDVSVNFRNSSSPEYWNAIRSSVKRKLHLARKLIKTGHKDLPPSEPIQMDSLWLVFNDDHGFMNASLHNVQVHGLSSVKLKDLASNELTSSVSVLFKMDHVLINGDYLIQHRQGVKNGGQISGHQPNWMLNDDQSAKSSHNSDTSGQFSKDEDDDGDDFFQEFWNRSSVSSQPFTSSSKTFTTSSTTTPSPSPSPPNQLSSQMVDESGRFVISVSDWFITWFSRVVDFDVTADQLTVERISVKSYHDNVTHQFISYLEDGLHTGLGHHRKDNNNKLLPDIPGRQSTIDTIASMIVSRVQSEIDARIGQLLSQFIIQQANQMTSLSEIIQYAIENHHRRMEEAMISAAAGALSRSKRQVPCEQGDELDEYVDSLFKFASRIVRAMEPISLPNATVELPEYNIKLFLHRGQATRAYKLQRKKSAWVYCGNESISLGLTVGFNDLLVKYRYRAIFDWSLLFDGELEAKVDDTKLQVQITQTTPDDDSEEELQQRVDRIRIWRLGRIRIILKGLGNLTQAVSMILTRALNSNQDQLEPTIRRVETEALGQINEMLKNISIPIFSVV
ncbi:uncharacterized protein LOC141854664 isoform X1 [Brevipalpus obovatus]|uniref:uncharacterized protein LOC141854664 isoform X1 n=1 Tax=Brevipalpus obovatus TaxID=246614 RepID=UPI003D9E78DC